VGVFLLKHGVHSEICTETLVLKKLRRMPSTITGRGQPLQS